MKTLLVKYLPSGEQSNTKKLLDIFLNETATLKHEMEVVDLLKTELPLFDEHSIQAYYKRNYRGEKLTADEEKMLEVNDKLSQQLKSADILVMAYPMHNFGIPAAVKAYLDAVILKGYTFDPGKKMMAGKKSLTLFTSGGIYGDKVVNLEYPNWNTLLMSAKINFNFMGYDESEVIGTSLREIEEQPARLAEMKDKISNVVKKFYSEKK